MIMQLAFCVPRIQPCVGSECDVFSRRVRTNSVIDSFCIVALHSVLVSLYKTKNTFVIALIGDKCVFGHVLSHLELCGWVSGFLSRQGGIAGCSSLSCSGCPRSMCCVLSFHLFCLSFWFSPFLWLFVFLAISGSHCLFFDPVYFLGDLPVAFLLVLLLRASVP